MAKEPKRDDKAPPEKGEPGDVASNPVGGDYSHGHPGVPPESKERK